MKTAGQAGFQIAPVGESVVVVVQADGKRDAYLAEIGNTDGLLAFTLCARQNRQKQRGKDADDGDDDQQFNQREGAMNSFCPSHFEMSIA